MSLSVQTRRAVQILIGLALLSAGAIAVGLAIHWPSHVPQMVVTTPPALIPGADTRDHAARIESLTQRRLGMLESRLSDELVAARQTPGRAWSDLRTAAIGLSMSGPLADLSQATLVTLGEYEGLRRALFFLMPIVRWMSQPFLFPVETEGVNAQEGLRRIRALIEAQAARGMRVTLDNVGDASQSPADAAAYQAFYLALLRGDGAADRPARVDVSLKLSALVHDLPAALGSQGAAKREEIRRALKTLLRQGEAGGIPDVFIRLDMEEYVYKDLTLEIFRELVESAPQLTRDAHGGLRLGIVTQAYLRDAARDLADLATWARSLGVRVPVRLVKGAYEVHEKDLARAEGRKSPVWNFKSSTDANYEALAEYLLRRGDVFKPAFATHNLRSQAHVMAVAETLGLPPHELEFQMLYGMGDPIKAALVGLGYGLCEYVPAGPLSRGLGYAGRRFHELANPDNALSRSLHGDFSALSARPEFQGDEDRADGAFTLDLLASRP